MTRSHKPKTLTTQSISEPSKLGRPSKLTDEVKLRLEKALKSGASHELAAQYAGIGVSTFYAWKKKAEEGDPNYQEFLEVIGNSESDGAIKILEKINAAIDEDWKAGAWILERRYPEMYGRQRIEHTGANGGPLTVRIVRGESYDAPIANIQSDEGDDE